MPPGEKSDQNSPNQVVVSDNDFADFGFEPTGLHFERYLPGEAATYQVIVGIRRKASGA